MEYSSQGIKMSAAESESGTYKKLYGLYKIPDMGGDTDKLDVSNFSDKNKRQIDSGITDYGTLQFNFYCNKDDVDESSEEVLDTYKYLKSAQIAGKSLYYKLEYPDGSTHTWLGGVSVKRDGAGVGEAMKFTLTTTVESEMKETFA